MTTLPAPKAGASQATAWLGSVLPGVALSALIAVLAVLGAPVVAKVFPIPAMVIALLIGIALNPFAHTPTVSTRHRVLPEDASCVGRWRCLVCGSRSATSRRLGWPPRSW